MGSAVAPNDAVGRPGAQAQPEQPHLRDPADPVGRRERDVDRRVGVQPGHVVGAHPRRAQRDQVAVTCGGSVGRGQADHDRAVAVADQRDLRVGPAGGQPAGEGDQVARAGLGPHLAGRFQADALGRVVAEPGHDRDLSRRASAAAYSERAWVAGARRATPPSPLVERRQRGVDAGHDDRDPVRRGQVADHLDRGAVTAGVEREEASARAAQTAYGLAGRPHRGRGRRVRERRGRPGRRRGDGRRGGGHE